MTDQPAKRNIGLLHLYSIDHWKIEYLTDRDRFFHSLHLLVPNNATLYFEGHQRALSFDRLLKRHPSSDSPHNYRAGSRPKLSRHAKYTSSLIKDILKFHRELWKVATFDHLHCYHQNRMIFWFHDALTGGDMVINKSVKIGQIRAFCSAQGPQYSKEGPIV